MRISSGETRRGWLCTLDPTIGHEIQKTRPCPIVSPDEMNRRLGTMIVVPLTTGSRPARYRVEVRFRDKDGLILPDQIRSVDRRRMLKHLGAVDDTTLSATLAVLADMFAP